MNSSRARFLARFARIHHRPSVSILYRSQPTKMFLYFNILRLRSASRFGITAASQGLDPDVLKGQTAVGAEVIVSAPQAALEFLAREYAAGVMRPLFHAMLAIAKRYQDQKTVIRLSETNGLRSIRLTGPPTWTWMSWSAWVQAPSRTACSGCWRSCRSSRS